MDCISDMILGYRTGFVPTRKTKMDTLYNLEVQWDIKCSMNHYFLRTKDYLTDYKKVTESVK